MKKTIFALAAAGVALATVPAQAAVVDFEDETAFRCDFSANGSSGGMKYSYDVVACYYSPTNPADFPTRLGSTVMASGFGSAYFKQSSGDAFSLDTIDSTEFLALTRRDRLADVEAGLAAAAKAGLTPVKVNAVTMRGVNDRDVAEVLQWCLDRGYELRFIEQMPLDAGHEWQASSMVTAAEVRERLGERFTLSPVGERGSAPAERFLVNGGPASVGIIASVSAPFCAACDRVRLTADGQVRNCLFANAETDLRGPLRGGASDAELAELIRAEMWRKEAGHTIGRADFQQPDRPMSAIGG